MKYAMLPTVLTFFAVTLAAAEAAPGPKELLLWPKGAPGQRAKPTATSPR